MDSESSSADSVRLKGTSIVKPFVFGSISQNLKTKRENDNHTHDWTVYIKPFNNEDMSSYVKKVQFKLHETYTNPVRTVTKPPYEISETGWGEFDIKIKIFFNDSMEKAVSLYHTLRLFHINDDVTRVVVLPMGRKSVVSEFYEEIIFQDPTPYMHNLLTTTRAFKSGTYKHETNFDDRKSRMMTRIQTGHSHIQSEIMQLKQKLLLAKQTISVFRQEIEKVERNKENEKSD